MAQRILIIEDDLDIIEILEFNLAREGYNLEVAKEGDTGMRLAKLNQADLILLDIMLPGLSGLQICKALKEDKDLASTPVIMLTANGEEEDIVDGLNMGADDYVTKPFNPKELLARVRAVLRRSQGAPAAKVGSTIKIGDLVINRDKYEVTLEGSVVNVTRSEFRLLETLASNPGRVFTRDQLLDRVCGADVTVVDRNIDVHIAALRRKLKATDPYVHTVRGVGYRFRDA